MNATRDPHIDAWYRNAATEEPPAALDAAVLAAAHRAVAAGPVAVPRPPRTPWLMPLAAAAVLVLSVTVLRLTPTEEVLPRPAESAAPGPREAVPSAPADTESGRKAEPAAPAQPAPVLPATRAREGAAGRTGGAEPPTATLAKRGLTGDDELARAKTAARSGEGSLAQGPLAAGEEERLRARREQFQTGADSAGPAPAVFAPPRAVVAPEPAGAASASPGGATQVNETGAKPPALRFEGARQSAVPAFAKRVAEPPAPERSTEGSAAKQEQRLADQTGGTAPRAAAPRAPGVAAPDEAGVASRVPVSPATRDANVWIQELLRLQAEGPETLFLKEFASFRAAHPRHPLPPRLQEALPRIEPIRPRAFPASPP
ncbi:MAG: hypothetical protein HYZ17_06775 [Betaproteobacteria bacterium]|nr:hypothetical protein [Betaproteobacteria bacterium]